MNKPVIDWHARAQAIAFDALLAQQYLKLDGVIDLSIADEEVVRRISGRRCCTEWLIFPGSAIRCAPNASP